MQEAELVFSIKANPCLQTRTVPGPDSWQQGRAACSLKPSAFQAFPLGLPRLLRSRRTGCLEGDQAARAESSQKPARPSSGLWVPVLAPFPCKAKASTPRWHSPREAGAAGQVPGEVRRAVPGMRSEAFLLRAHSAPAAAEATPLLRSPSRGQCHRCPTHRPVAARPRSRGLSPSVTPPEGAAACGLLPAGLRGPRFSGSAMGCVRTASFPSASKAAVPFLRRAPRALPGAGPVEPAPRCARLRNAEPGAPAGHGLCGGTGRRRAGRPRGAKAIVLDWRMLTQMAREKQIGREMNKLYR